MAAMTGRVRSTHEIEIDGGQVVKRFRSGERDEPRREWRALTLLAEFAPGLAPVPVGSCSRGIPATPGMVFFTAFQARRTTVLICRRPPGLAGIRPDSLPVA
jgi:hypothetical protein